ncbi:selenide, water dikinase SelD [Dehalogenimonas formicexedens]|uniref:selenide, water dikinase SelD n=1 Tax=Dehalogenimonas formicexedens TaxID=1839801 RepID=UPI00096B96BE
MGPGDLAKALCGLPIKSYPEVLVGLEMPDDAGVYQLTPEIALVQTIDVITPVVDDPFAFGQVATANALSDVYAMGGKPVTAMSFVGFPSGKMEIESLRLIMEGALSKLDEAGCALVGGHSVKDDEIKFGLSVTGIIHPKKVLTKGGGQPGDKLILTKPLGTGILNTALKGGQLNEAGIGAVISQMIALNKTPAEIVDDLGAHAATDITGFGLIGHAAEMMTRNEVGFKLYWNQIPLMEGAERWAKAGLIPGGAYSNREYREDLLDPEFELDEWMLDVLFDPQTSGGLLIAAQEPVVEDMVSRIRAAGFPSAAIIGEVIADPKGRIIITE